MRFINRSTNASNVCSIKGDCERSMGNIDFDGNVYIAGGVKSGSIVKATGSIVIAGGVEAATIIAGGNVEMKSGMQGADKGVIEAGGSVSALYIERGRVIADGSITFDASIHSFLEAGTNIIAKGKRGAIIGGKAFATGNILANFVGAVSNTKTEITVGIMKKCGCPSKTEKLKDKQKKAPESKVHVFNTAFAGAHISIGSVTYMVNKEILFTTFKYKNGKIAHIPYELRAQDERLPI